MQKKKFLLLFVLGFLLNTWTTYSMPPCNLPAPANIQFNQPNSFTLNVTWNAVPGASSYAATLQNLSTPVAVQAFTPVAPSQTFTVIPGEYYLLRVAARCLQPDGSEAASPNHAESQYVAESIIVDVIAKMSGPCSNFSTLVNGVINVGGTFQHSGFSSGTHYVIEFLGAGLGGYIPTYEFYYVNSLMPKFVLGNHNPLDNSNALAGLSANGYDVPPVLGASKARVTKPGQSHDYRGYVAFPSSSTIYFQGEVGSLYQSFTQLRISVCQSNQAPGGGERSISEAPATTAQAALRNILPVNPFSSHLTLYFQEHPEQPVTAQLFEVSGRMHIQQTIDPTSVGENSYILNTADLLPGMYFLRLETAPGVFSTHKVVKYDE